MVLRPHALWRCRTLHQAVDILSNRVVGQLRRCVFGAHTFTALCPSRTAILGEPDAPRRHCDPRALRIAWVDTD
jgi:hypothetical protein